MIIGAMDLTAVVLAGGASSRYGSDKARAIVGGRRMIDRVADAARKHVDEVLVSVGNPSVRYDVEGARHVIDQVQGAGPLAGLHAALSAMHTSWLLALACDMPFLTDTTLDVLLGARSEDAQAIVACTPDGRRHPLCACYQGRILPVVDAHLRAGNRALVALLDALPRVRYVDLAPDALRNVNIATDLSLATYAC